MDRREFVKTGVIATMGAGLKPHSKGPAKRPNVLYVFGDQHRAASLPDEPFSQVQAPNIDAFRRANMSMDTCISNYPLCCPYRTILMTGNYSPENGVVSNEIAMRTSDFTITKAFKASGYRVGYVGKWHLAGDHDMNFAFIPPGPGRVEIDDWHIWEDTNNHYKCWTYDATGKKIFATQWAPVDMTNEAIGLMKEYAGQPEDKPWMLFVSWNPPHPPFNPPQNDRDANPENMQKYRPNVKLSPRNPTPWLRSEDGFHKAMQGYIGGITGIDTEFGRILKALDETGQADNTIVIFTSDHGEMMGSQGKKGKVFPYDESNHVPFAVRYPGVTPKSGSSKALFSAVDIYPTVCGLAGVPVPEHCSGHDLSDLLRGKKVDGPKTVFIMGGKGGTAKAAHAGKVKEYENGDRVHPPDQGDDEDAGEGKGGSPVYRGVRTDRYTYTVTENGRWLLFDNTSDPYQLKNLAEDAAHKSLMDGFDTQIKGWIKKTGDTFIYPALG